MTVEMRPWARKLPTAVVAIFIVATLVIMKAVALGWPDHSFPANAVVSERKTLEEAVTFLGFQD